MELEGDIVQRRLIFNPKNRFLCIFCHATDVGGSWGCNWSFQSGIIFFSIIILAASLWDIVELAKFKAFQDAPSSTYTFFFCLKVFSDIINLIVIFIACYGLFLSSIRYSIISYWVSCLSLLLNSIFIIYSLFAIFAYYERIWHAILAAIVLEFGLILFSWILFCNEVDHIRKVKNNDYSFQY